MQHLEAQMLLKTPYDENWQNKDGNKNVANKKKNAKKNEKET